MIITRHDRPIGKARASKPFEADLPEPGEYRINRDDKHAMCWKQLCRTTRAGVTPGEWHHLVNVRGMHPTSPFRGWRFHGPQVMMSLKEVCAAAGVSYKRFRARRLAGHGFRRAMGFDD